jgi:hypothetical protein
VFELLTWRAATAGATAGKSLNILAVARAGITCAESNRRFVPLHAVK